MLKIEHLVAISCIVGFIGDALLQFATKYLRMGGRDGWGLAPYFIQHGSIESLFIAGGMMTLFYILLGPLPKTYPILAIHGMLIDLFFRKTMIFPSLKGYYEYFNHFWSAVWMAIPMIIPLLIYDILLLI